MKTILPLVIFLSITSICPAAQTIVVKKVTQAPVIDGRGDDSVWSQTGEIITHDNVANIDISLRAVYFKEKIFFLVSYPDKDESRAHKTWKWNKKTKMYDRGPEREDMFVFKWSMEKNPVNLSVFSNANYTADIWFWKAQRTDPVGYADDKIQHLSSMETPKTKKIINPSGIPMFLQRRGDEGTSSYKDTLFVNYQKDRLSHFTNRTPTESRADIKAKGVWSDGRWTIEFTRAFDTGHTDDIQFHLNKTYQFGVSRYEIAGRDPNPALSQPFYASGDISEELHLKFENN